MPIKWAPKFSIYRSVVAVMVPVLVFCLYTFCQHIAIHYSRGS